MLILLKKLIMNDSARLRFVYVAHGPEREISVQTFE